jgi:hypothetical protein
MREFLFEKKEKKVKKPIYISCLLLCLFSCKTKESKSTRIIENEVEVLTKGNTKSL